MIFGAGYFVEVRHLVHNGSCLRIGTDHWCIPESLTELDMVWVVWVHRCEMASGAIAIEGYFLVRESFTYSLKIFPNCVVTCGGMSTKPVGIPIRI